MCFQNLSDIHTARYAQWIKNNLNRLAIRQERHVFTWHNAGNNALVTVTACHLIAFRNLTFLSDVYTYLLVNARWQFISVFAGEHFHTDNFTSFAMWNAQGKWQPGWTATQSDMLADDWEIVE